MSNAFELFLLWVSRKGNVFLTTDERVVLQAFFDTLGPRGSGKSFVIDLLAQWDYETNGRMVDVPGNSKGVNV